MGFIVVGYYTRNTLYEEEVKRLIKSLKKFKLPYDIEEIDNLGSWIANVNYKPKLCRKMLEKYNRPILYLDSDAVVKQYPKLFSNIQCDMAVYYREKVELLTGTLYFNNTPSAKKIIDAWITETAKYPYEWDQKSLQNVLFTFKKDIHIFILPSNYCQIYDIMRAAGKPVIEHFQASRRYVHNITKVKGPLYKIKYLFYIILTKSPTFKSKVCSMMKYFRQYKRKYIG